MKPLKKNNQNKRIAVIAAVILVTSAAIAFLYQNNQPDKIIKLGWQPPWVNQGQIVEVLKHSDLLNKNGIQVDFKAFSYGGPMSEAALAGDLDILFAGDQPAITLLSKDPEWRIVARMTNYRSAIIVPLNSPLKTIEDLKGKKIAAAFGSTTYRDTYRELLNAGIDPKKDLQLINLDQAEHATVISQSNGWNEIDAIATYDPTIAISVNRGKAKVLKEWESPSVVLVKNDFIINHREELKAFLKSYVESYVVYSQDPRKYNSLYAGESRLTLTDETYSIIARMEPNLNGVKNVNDVDVVTNDTRKKMLIVNADIAFKIGLIKKQIALEKYIDNSFFVKN